MDNIGKYIATRDIYFKEYELQMALQMDKENLKKTRADYARAISLSHYTSINALFSILNSDSFWLGSSKESNDSTEGCMLEKENKREEDDYILCLCLDGDRLSQWRGYCPHGGASIELAFEWDGNGFPPNIDCGLATLPSYFSVLHRDYSVSHLYFKYENSAIATMYLPPYPQNSGRLLELRQLEPSPLISLEAMVPYLKHNQFVEENEYRIVFTNHDKCLSESIAYRTAQDKQILPYIVVRFGDIAQEETRCDMTVSEIKEEINRSACSSSFWIPQGYNQEELYNVAIYKCSEIRKEGGDYTFPPILCRGHLPVRKIRIAPTHNRDKIQKQVKAFCQSKYWLRNVEVKCSAIPYIPPNE